MLSQSPYTNLALVRHRRYLFTIADSPPERAACFLFTPWGADAVTVHRSRAGVLGRAGRQCSGTPFVQCPFFSLLKGPEMLLDLDISQIQPSQHLRDLS